MTVGPLLAVFGLLLGRPAAVGTRNVLLFLGFGLHLTFVRILAFTAPSEGDAILKNTLKIVVAYHSKMGLIWLIGLMWPMRPMRPMRLIGPMWFSDGTSERP